MPTGPDANAVSDSEEQKEIFRNDPKKYLLYRKNIESELNTRFRFILNGSAEQQAARQVSNVRTIQY